MVEADTHLRLLPTSISDIYRVFELLVCCLKGIWMHPYTLPQSKLAWDFGMSVTSKVEMMPFHHGWGWHPPQIDHIHVIHVQCVWGIGIDMLSQGHVGAPLHRSTDQVGPRFWRFRSLVECQWCHCIMVEADTHLRLLPTSILDI